MRIIAAVPNWNMGSSLIPLLASLSAESLDGIYVLDDASEDGSPGQVEATFPDVVVVRGEHNAGAAANRNRILPFLTGKEIIIFLDADMELKTHSLREAVRGSFSIPYTGIVGGLILDADGDAMEWNYGFAMNEDNCNIALADAYSGRRQVDWVAEGLFSVRSDVFRKVDGCDTRFRYHEGQDLGLRVKQAGYDVVFDPRICARHLEIDVRGAARSREWTEGRRLLHAKHPRRGIGPDVVQRRSAADWSDDAAHGDDL
jgi:GT2 family glycosyltransferase